MIYDSIFMFSCKNDSFLSSLSSSLAIEFSKMFCHFWISKIKYVFIVLNSIACVTLFVNYIIKSHILMPRIMLRKSMYCFATATVYMLIGVWLLSEHPFYKLKYMELKIFSMQQYEYMIKNNSFGLSDRRLVGCSATKKKKKQTRQTKIMILKFLIVLFWYANLEC